MELKIVNKKSIKIALLLFPFFTYALGLKWQVAGMVVNAMRVMSMLLVSIWFVTHRSGLSRFLKIKIVDLIFLLFLIIAISSVLNGKSISSAAQLAMYAIMPFTIFNMFINTKNGLRHILEGTVLIFVIINIANLIFMIIFRNGIYQTYTANTVTKYFLFGGKNQMVAPIITGTFFVIEYSFYRYNKLSKKCILLCLINLLELVWGGSGTGLLMFGLIVVAVALKDRLKNKFKLKYGLGAVFAIAIGLVVFRVQNYFSFLIEAIMHKSLTLSDRTFIWDAALLLVKSKLFTGYGVGKSLSGEVFIDLGYMSETIFAHDIFLDYLVMGGLFALVVFILILLETQKEYKEMISITRYWKTFIWIGVLIYMCASIVEIYTGNYCLFLMIAYITFMYKVAVREKIESKDSEEGKKSQCTE